MNIKALITTLVLGSSSVAMAKPVLTVSGSVSVGGKVTTVRDHRAPVVDDCGGAPVIHQPVVYQPVRPAPQPWFNPTNTTVGATGSVYVGSYGRSAISPHTQWQRPATWFSLTEATRIDGGREFFKLQGGKGGFFTKLQLKNLGGRTEIEQIGIEYMINGRPYVQKVTFNGVLSSSGLTINLERDSRTINRIIVYGTSARGSAYQMFAL